MALSVATRGALTQSILYERNKAEDPWCKVSGQRGTPHHRFWMCSALRDDRAVCPRTWQHMGEQAQPESMLWCRGLDNDPDF